VAGGRRTDGVVRRGCGSGGASKGGAAREAESGPLERLYSGSDGVETLDMFAWPEANVARRSLCAEAEYGAGTTTGGHYKALAISWMLATCRASGEQLQERRDGGGRFFEEQTDRSGLMN
jgi:hypothetical protein